MYSLFIFLLPAIPLSLVHAASAICPPAVNAASLNLIKQYEGFMPRPFKDPIGQPSVGYGHICKTKDCSELKLPLTKETATQLLIQDLVPTTTCLNNALNANVRLNDNQFGALTSWTFSIGCKSMQASTLRARLNRGEDPNKVASQELPVFPLVGRQGPSPWLVRRRSQEVKLFKTPSGTIVHPC